MKKMKIWYQIVMYLPLVTVIIALFFLPDQVPMHYGADNQVTRWGSKYEELIFPILTIAYGWFMLLIAKTASKKEQKGNKNNERITVLAGLLGMILFNVMNCYFLIASFGQATNLSDTGVDLYSMLFAVTGIIFVILGNYLPKTKMNSVTGFRIPSSMKNEEVWKKCQRFSGITLMFTGVIITIISVFFFRGLMVVILSLGILLLSVLVDVIYARVIA